jgi:hypothetical protein
MFKLKHIYNLIEMGKNGTKTTLTVNSFKTNQPACKINLHLQQVNIKLLSIN